MQSDFQTEYRRLEERRRTMNASAATPLEALRWLEECVSLLDGADLIQPAAAFTWGSVLIMDGSAEP